MLLVSQTKWTGYEGPSRPQTVGRLVALDSGNPKQTLGVCCTVSVNSNFCYCETSRFCLHSEPKSGKKEAPSAMICARSTGKSPWIVLQTISRSTLS